MMEGGEAVKKVKGEREEVGEGEEAVRKGSRER